VTHDQLEQKIKTLIRGTTDPFMVVAVLSNLVAEVAIQAWSPDERVYLYHTIDHYLWSRLSPSASQIKAAVLLGLDSFGDADACLCWAVGANWLDTTVGRWPTLIRRRTELPVDDQMPLEEIMGRLRTAWDRQDRPLSA